MKKRLLCIILSAIALTACSNGDRKYVSDISEIGGEKNDIEKDDDVVKVDLISDEGFDFKYATRPLLRIQDTKTYDKDNMYIFGMGSSSGNVYVRLSLRTGKLSGLCAIPGCEHTEPECLYRQGINYPLAVEDELWFVQNDKLYSRKLSEIGEANMLADANVLFQNTYSTQFEEENFPEYPRQITGFIVTENSIFVKCSSYLFRIDRVTMKADEPIKVCDNIIYTMCVDGNTAYVTNDLNELYKIDFETRKVTKLGDKITFPSVYDGRLYYLYWGETLPWLCSASLDGTDEQRLIEDCYVNYLIKDGNVFYTQFSKSVLENISESDPENVVESRMTYICPLDTLEKRLILEFETSDIVSAPQTDRVFLFPAESDRSKNIYIVKTDGSDELTLTNE